MIKIDKTVTPANIGAIVLAILTAGMLYARAETQLQSMTTAVQELRQSVGQLNNEVIKLRLQMIETRTSFEMHKMYDEGKNK